MGKTLNTILNLASNHRTDDDPIRRRGTCQTSIDLGMLPHKVAEGRGVQEKDHRPPSFVKHASLMHRQLALRNGMFHFIYVAPLEMGRFTHYLSDRRRGTCFGLKIERSYRDDDCLTLGIWKDLFQLYYLAFGYAFISHRVSILWRIRWVVIRASIASSSPESKSTKPGRRSSVSIALNYGLLHLFYDSSSTRYRQGHQRVRLPRTTRI